MQISRDTMITELTALITQLERAPEVEDDMGLTLRLARLAAARAQLRELMGLRA